RQRIQLEEGLELTFYQDSDANEDIEVEGRVFYEPGADGARGHWSATYEPDSVRYVPVGPAHEDAISHPCFQCRQDLRPYFAEHGRNEETRCPACGTRIMVPMLPPGL